MRRRRALAALLVLGGILWGGPPAHAHHRIVHHMPGLFVTGYDLLGQTATGAWAGPGVCAVDPRYIPLGAWVHIPGLGTCHALDTGGAIIGWHIDVWESTASVCYRITGMYSGATWWR